MKIGEYECLIMDGRDGFFLRETLERKGVDLSKHWYAKFEQAIKQKVPYVRFIDSISIPMLEVRYNLIRRDIKPDGETIYVFAENRVPEEL